MINYGYFDLEEDKFKDECGVFGIRMPDDFEDSARITYLGLYALQHRGQESAGIAVFDGTEAICHKGMGLYLMFLKKRYFQT
jgi:amidophosphoribosyltransferase